ncbi:MAG: phosphoserine transaminase [Alphaproteobacteria bacterium]|nr:phosphoserine transaminase [Alphaproteobacteria bacterium]MBT5799573.1 phosphoserine transaminase [Alphaproteobacteria bacterium]
MLPALKPSSALFSSGPTKKFPGWNLSHLSNTAHGRSHRATLPKQKLSDAINKMSSMLGLPDGYRLGIVPASDTGAIEMAMWSVLGAKPVDILSWESFGQTWVSDVTKQLKLSNVRHLDADWGKLPDLSDVNFDNDVVFCWNGTTSGVCVPDGEWIPEDREGLTIVDATSACFAMTLDWSKIDIATFSWQKSLGGEAAHGVIILSPRAVDRLESYTPAWPMPKIFQLTKNGKLIEGIFKGETINTPSLLCLEDLLAALNWAEEIGGLDALINRSEQNLQVVSDWVDASNWAGFLAVEPNTRSNTSICLTINDPHISQLPEAERKDFAKAMTKRLEEENVAFDIGAYRTAPAGLRIWGGPTIDTSDISILLEWLDYVFEEQKRIITSPKEA